MCGGSAVLWVGRWTCDWRSRVQSQPLHCRVRPWTSCSHAFAGWGVNRHTVRHTVRVSMVLQLRLVRGW